MGQAIAVRTDFTAGEVRRFARRAKDAAQARRLLAIAAVLDGASREDAAKIGGMDRQTLRDWVIRFNERGQDGLINIPSPGVPPKLGKKHRAFLARLVEEGAIPAVDGMVRWRAGDLIMRLHERSATWPISIEILPTSLKCCLPASMPSSAGRKEPASKPRAKSH